VFPVLSSLITDPKFYSNPEDFYPEPFLDERGNLRRLKFLCPFPRVTDQFAAMLPLLSTGTTYPSCPIWIATPYVSQTCKSLLGYTLHLTRWKLRNSKALSIYIQDKKSDDQTLFRDDKNQWSFLVSQLIILTCRKDRAQKPFRVGARHLHFPLLKPGVDHPIISTRDIQSESQLESNECISEHNLAATFL
jgi:hypothetical protein